MPANESPRRPVSTKGVKVLSTRQGDGKTGVKTLSKAEGGAPETEATSRVVGHEEFGKTKKLIEDKDMEK